MNRQPTGLSVAVCGRPCCSIPRTGINSSLALEAFLILLDPRTNRQPTGLSVAVCGRPVLFDSSDGLHKKTPNPEIGSFFMTRTGIEPMLQP